MIQLLIHWNGYAPGVKNFSAAEEARLVAAGLARPVVAGGASTMRASDILPVVGVVTSLVPSTPNNEYITQIGFTTQTTDGDIEWGGQQSRMVRMADGTLFATAQETGQLRLKRSATGGTYGSAWTLVDSVADANRASVDLDHHILRNPVTNEVHLIWADVSLRVRVRTYDSAGVVVSDVMVPDIHPTRGQYAFYREGTGSARTSASIGADGTIALARICTTAPPDYYVPQLVAGMQVQTLRWDGASWAYSGSAMLDTGPALSYMHLWVSPPGHEGYIVGLGFVNVTWKQWTQARNPYYNGTWANTIASNTYFGGGRYPEFRMFKIPIAAPDSIEITTVLGPNYRTTDISSANPSNFEYMAYAPNGVAMDQQGRIWFGYSGNEDGVANQTRLRVINTDGSLAYDLTNPGGYSNGGIYFFHEDMTGKMWLGWSVVGTNVVGHRITPTTEAAGALTVTAFSSAVDLGPGAWGTDLTAARWEGIASIPRYYDHRNGSVRTHNWFDVYTLPLPNHTGTAPGTAVGVAASGAMKAKRVRIQLPI